MRKYYPYYQGLIIPEIIENTTYTCRSYDLVADSSTQKELFWNPVADEKVNFL